MPDWTEPIVVTDLTASTRRSRLPRCSTSATTTSRRWPAAPAPGSRLACAVERGLSGVMEPPDDLVPAGPERSYADMIEYLRWEEALGKKYAT